jgi:hypothetical protein
MPAGSQTDTIILHFEKKLLVKLRLMIKKRMPVKSRWPRKKLPVCPDFETENAQRIAKEVKIEVLLPNFLIKTGDNFPKMQAKENCGNGG